MLQQQQQPSLPGCVVVSTGRSRQRDHVSVTLRDSITALLSSWSSPFAVQKPENSSSTCSKLEAAGAAVSEWLQQVSQICHSVTHNMLGGAHVTAVPITSCYSTEHHMTYMTLLMCWPPC